MAGTFDNLPVWTIPPDWTGGVLERLEWLTDVLTSSSGAEQRSRRRLTPRRTFEMGLTVQGPERVLYGLQVKAAGASDWYIPVWHDIIRTQAAIVAGVGNESSGLGIGLLAIPCSTAGHEYQPGGLVILYGDPFTYEIAIISHVLSDKVTLTLPTDLDWPAGTRLMPVMRGRLTAEPSGTRVTDGVLTGRVSFTSTRPNPWPDSFGSYPTYKGFPVLTLEPDESGSLSEAYQRLTSVLDNLTGRSFMTDTAGFGFTAQQYRWFLSGLAEHAALRSLLYALHGRLAPLWVPTFAADLELVQPVAAADTAIVVNRCGYTDFPTEGRSEILFQLADGSQVFGTISGSAVDGEAEVLGLATPIGRDLPLSLVERISFMAVCRQDSDTVEIAHQTDAAGVATVATVFREAPDIRSPAWDALNPADSLDVELTNFDQTVIHVRGNTPFIRSRHGKRAGKWYFEGTTPSPFAANFSTWLGICTLDATYSEMAADALKGCLAGPFGFGFDIRVLGAVPITIIPYLEGITTMGYAIDLDNKLFWFSPKPGSRWNNSDTANPATGVGGFSFAALGDVDMYLCAVGDVVSLTWHFNLGTRPYQRVIPSGFHPGWTAA